MKATVVIDKETGEASFLHSDQLVDEVNAPVKIVRLSTIEPGGCGWQVKLAATGNILYSHKHRAACLDWEHLNAADLILRTLRRKQCN